ncbi:FAD-dependent monooxygenase [Actinomycetospora sp. TBRC 11914]|uniref:FAD-dependent monooxygenase n=1 Tax=Actinomycetospora sp. TBRC 11914 TaxID=2729387 RepID=UPI00145EC47F|nr:FAD-dependent monooxygenase [Actinomycetospora sp. TBRC 11914]NMO90390.1 NAD(P)-binding protein [Actinomycetospora sp. TBRC 11914]
MRVQCIGGGPAGLYTAIALKRQDPRHDVTVWERNARGVTHGWGVVFWDDLLDEMHRVDPASASAVRDAAVVWDGQAVQVGRRSPVFLGGAGYAIGRQRLLTLLGDRAEALGVDLRYATAAPEDLAGPGLRAGEPASLVVAADGAGSGLRRRRTEELGTRLAAGRNRYLWSGTPALFSTFTFGFVDTGSGWIWCHAYRFDETTSTFIVEAPPDTWAALGFADLATPACLDLLAEIFDPVLHGAPLLAGRSEDARAPWQTFRRVTNERWCDGRLALAGDAAHTTHFAIGSGTRLALGDAVALAEHVREVELDEHLAAALASYDARRRPEIRPLQDEALRSSAWFEDPVGLLEQGDDLGLGWSLWQRRRRAPAWRWYLHRASQHAPMRRVRTSAGTLRRHVRARRRRWSVPLSAGPARPRATVGEER